MRDRLERAVFKGRQGFVAAAGITLGIVAAVWALASSSIVPGPGPAAAATPTEPPPQAAASAPEPTLAALTQVQATPIATVEPSPFAGITVPPVEPPRRSGLTRYAVQAGDVLWQIAEQYQLRPETVLWANDIGDPNLLLVGQQLAIPATDGVLSTVQPGDSLADVANRYGVELQAIVDSNALADVNQIQAGVDIFLPG